MVPLENQATLWFHLTSWNLLDSQLCRESKMEPSLATIIWQPIYRITSSDKHTHVVKLCKGGSKVLQFFAYICGVLKKNIVN